MNDILGLLLVLLFGGAGLISVFTIVDLLLPLPVERIRLSLETNLVRSLLLGMVNSLLAGALFVLCIWLAQQVGGVVAGLFVFLAGLIGLALTLLLLLGLVAITTLLGNRIGQAGSPLTAHLRGGGMLVLACLTPYFGWFVFTPLVVWTALGAAVQVLVRRKNVVVAADPGHA